MTFRARTAGVLIAGLVMASLLVVPVQAKGTDRRCPKFRPRAIETGSQRAAEIPQIPVVNVTGSATKADPVIIEFDQGAAAWWWMFAVGRGPIVDANEYFNVQVDTDKRLAGLHVRLEWDVPPAELDLYMFDRDRTLVAGSEAFNQLPAELTGDTGGPGYEYINGYPAHDCAGFTIEDNAMWSPPQPARLKLWLGPADWSE